jgi:glycosyltransferase involved in cell wall biosynthesis
MAGFAFCAPHLYTAIIMINGKKVVVVMPAYNTARTLEKTVAALPRGAADGIIVVDDGSRDETAAIAARLPVVLLKHPKNRGYGGAQKTGYRAALDAGADVIVMVHSDFQYDPALMPNIARPVAEGKADVCFGSRMAVAGDARRGGMPWWRYVPNRALTILEEAVLGLGISEYHSGYRAFARGALERIPFEKNSENYVFDTEMLAALSMGGFRAAEIPIPTRYVEDSQSPNFRKSVEYGLMTLATLVRYMLHRRGVRSYPRFIITKNPV